MSRLHIGVVAGEASGDILGARVLAALRERFDEVVVEGIGGPLMQEQGLASLYPMERLSVMGFIDPLKRLPELLRIRRRLRQHFCQRPPDLFLGIDAPDFNLRLEMLLRRSGIPTAHLVSPSVWAWRRGRVRKIRRAVDLMLCLFPFETNIYRQHGVPVRYIGHPLADEISPDMDSDAVRRQLELAACWPCCRAAVNRKCGCWRPCSCKQLACCTMTGHSSVLLSPRRAKSAWGNSRACCRSIRTSL